MPLDVKELGIIPYTYDSFLKGIQTDEQIQIYYVFNQSDESVLYKNLHTVLDSDENSYLYKNILKIHNNEYLGISKNCDILRINYIKSVIDYIIIYALETININNSVLSINNKKIKIELLNNKYKFKCIEEYIRCKYGIELLNLYYKLIQTSKNYLNNNFLLFNDLQEILFGNNKQIKID